MRKIIKKSAYLSALLLVLSGVISCEEDFTDIGTSIIGNSKFTTDSIFLEVEITQRNIDAIRGDNLSIGSIGEYLLGVYQDEKGHYEKIEGSLVTQIGNSINLDLTLRETDTTTVTSIMENAFIKLPYIATKKTDNTDGTPVFSLDSVLGSTTVGVSLKVYRNMTFLNTLDPQNPVQGNSYKTNSIFEKGELLNENANFTFIPNANDTIYEFDRTLKDGSIFKDTLKLTNANPFLVIPLNKALMKSLFFDKFEDDEFASQDALNNYFRGLIIEASGNENSLVPFSSTAALNPTLEINYTGTVEKISNGEVLDTLKRTASFSLSGLSIVNNRLYKMTPETSPANANQVIVQGAAGKIADVKILQGTQLQDLKDKKLLINDATLTFYIDQSRDVAAIPERLFLYREEPNFSAQIKDAYSEGFDNFSGILEKKDTDGDGVSDTNDNYKFKITDYISDVLGPASLNNSNLVLKVYNTTDNPVKNQALDKVVTNYSWNPRAVTLTNHLPSNGVIEGTRKAQLKIIYSERKN
ncbi:MAG: DUF4270 family protein [Polaribacter sp.]|uniref:DUF4270 family protein n=1 Tax=Polaribacter sp. TaxID=1920175 RepID=UPI002F35E49B